MRKVLFSKRESPTILESNILYLLIGLALITIGSIAQSIDIYIGLLITEYIIILIPILLYLKIKGYSIRKTLRIKNVSFKQIIYTLVIMLLSYPIGVFFNYIGIIFLSKYGKLLSSPVPIPNSAEEFILGLIVLSITPGICEEIMFRGMLMKSYEPLGKKKAIIYSAILFGIFHFNLQNLLGPTFLGIIFGVLAYKTNSIIIPIIAHMINNLIALSIGFYADRMGDISVDNSNTMLMTEEQMMLTGAIVMGLVAVVLGFIVYRLILSMPGDEDKNSEAVWDVEGEINTSPRLYRRRNMDIIESFPLFLFLIIFLFFNYKYFFMIE